LKSNKTLLGGVWEFGEASSKVFGL